VSGPEIRVGRGVIAEVARLAALEVPAVLRVGRGGPAWRVALSGPPISIRVRGEDVAVRLWLIARPGADLVATTRAVRSTVAAAIERLLALRVETITIFVDGVGG
jgi:uncharacterized alkaline shock family protein YloU